MYSLQLEISKLVCSLCKNEYVLENSSSSLTTQLCPECRSIIDTIRPVQRTSGTLGHRGVTPPERSPTTVPPTRLSSQLTQQDHIAPPVEPASLDDQLFGETHTQAAAPSHTPEPELPKPFKRTPFPTLEAVTEDHSDEEHQWTLVVGEEKREVWPIVRVSLVVILILACGAAGYLYFMRWRNRPATTNTQKTPEQLKALAAKQNEPAKPSTESAQPAKLPAEGTQTPSTSVAKEETAATAEKPAAVQPPKDEPAPGVKLLTLQAASFPNEAAATTYSEKLIKAGVPAYVIGADVPHKGRWYRVRAGKFEKAEEAKSYIAQWQKRAGSVGLSIQWIVLDYEKP